MKKLYERYMFFIGISGSLIFYLQAITIFTEKSAAAVSLLAFIFGLISVASWMVYAIVIRDRVLLVSNVFASIGAFLVVIAILIYKP